ERFVPVLLALMAWAFTTYLVLKGLKALVEVSFLVASGLGLVAAVVAYLWTGPWVQRRALVLDNNRDGVNALFTLPLIFSAALLSFADGAYDVANYVGPLAVINVALTSNDIVAKDAIPIWFMQVGVVGIAVGLLLFGPKLIKTVGPEITELD